MSTQTGEERAVKRQPESVIGAPGPREPEAYSGHCNSGHGYCKVERWCRRVRRLAFGP